MENKSESAVETASLYLALASGVVPKAIKPSQAKESCLTLMRALDEVKESITPIIRLKAITQAANNKQIAIVDYLLSYFTGETNLPPWASKLKVDPLEIRANVIIKTEIGKKFIEAARAVVEANMVLQAEKMISVIDSSPDELFEKVRSKEMNDMLYIRFSINDYLIIAAIEDAKRLFKAVEKTNLLREDIIITVAIGLTLKRKFVTLEDLIKEYPYLIAPVLHTLSRMKKDNIYTGIWTRETILNCLTEMQLESVPKSLCKRFYLSQLPTQ